MAEERDNEIANGRLVLELIVAIGVSFVLQYVSIGLPFFLIPLLVLAGRRGRDMGLVAFVAVALATVSTGFLTSPYKGVYDAPLWLMLQAIELYFPLSLSAAGIIWMISRKRRWDLRIALSLIPSVLLYLVFFVLLERDPALLEGVKTYYGNVLEVVLSVFFDVEALGQELVSMFRSLFFLTMLSIAVPSVLVLACANFYLAERSLHSRESGFEDSISRLELKGWAIWIFLGSWLGVLAVRFMSSLPLAVAVALFNVAFSMTICYAVQGFSVVFYRLRRKGRGIGSFALLMLIAVVSVMMPGINIVVVLGLPLVGVLESFFELRR